MQNLPVQDWRGTQRESLGEILCVSKVKLQHLPFQVGHGSGEGWREGGMDPWMESLVQAPASLLPPLQQLPRGVLPTRKGKKVSYCSSQSRLPVQGSSLVLPKGSPSTGKRLSCSQSPCPRLLSEGQSQGLSSSEPWLFPGVQPSPCLLPKEQHDRLLVLYPSTLVIVSEEPSGLCFKVSSFGSIALLSPLHLRSPRCLPCQLAGAGTGMVQDPFP